ncbi:MAG: HAD family phosphatase [Saprospiraceae bacterium]|jgi:HAD superfamily hydrolase (TIGR01509 family)|nr:HAD family phosphatase [Saprospiraceae bacterium]
MKNSNGTGLPFELDDVHLVIWDCDGVLVDSERLAAKAIAIVIREFGGETSPDLVHQTLRGSSLDKAMQFIRTHAHVPPGTGLEEVYRNRSFEIFSNSLKPVPGVESILSGVLALQCVASNGPRPKILHNLRLTGLSGYFSPETIFSGHDLQKFKPDPELFLHAARSLSVDPQNCLVIEDSRHGAQAAALARMKCLGYAAETQPGELTEHRAYPFATMNQLYLIMKNAGLIAGSHERQNESGIG